MFEKYPRATFWLKLEHALQLHDAIYRLRFYSNSLIHILSLSNSDNNIAPIQKNRGDKSHSVIVAVLNQNPTKKVVLLHKQNVLIIVCFT